jgi:hypothetical protein
MNDEFDLRIALEEWNGAYDLDPLDPPTVRAEAGVMINQLADTLDEKGQAVLCAIRGLGDRAFKRNGTLNVSRIAAMAGQPQRTMARRVEKIKGCAGAMSLCR